MVVIYNINMGNKTTGLKSIAYELEISVNTVSRALRDCDDISEATKEKVRKKAYELGYLPNTVSQFIKRDDKKLVAIILNSLKNHFFSIIGEKLINTCMQEDLDFCFIYSLNKKIDNNIIKQCISQRVDVIVSLLEPDSKAIDTCKLNGIPFIMVGRNINSDYVDCIYTNDADGGRIVANYLVNYHHLTKLIYIKMSNVECSKRRFKAFESTVKELNKDADIVVLDENYSKKHLLELITSGYLGVFCFNDELAYDVLSEINSEIPNFRKIYPRFHLIGYDCLNTRGIGLIDITSIDFDYDEICKQTFRLIQQKINCIDGKREEIVIPVSLHQRKYF